MWPGFHGRMKIEAFVSTGEQTGRHQCWCEDHICQYWNRLWFFVCCKYTNTHLRHAIILFRCIFQRSSLLHSQGYKSKRRSSLFYFHVIWSLSLWIKCSMTEYDCKKKNDKNIVYKYFCFLQYNTAQSIYQPATIWMVQGSNTGGGEMFRTHPD
jgi:hypothetical protein